MTNETGGRVRVVAFLHLRVLKRALKELITKDETNYEDTKHRTAQDSRKDAGNRDETLKMRDQ
jgi:hypothetical protein